MSKPVAWMLKDELKNGLDGFFEHSQDYPDWQIKAFKEFYIPLYTHPQKELTDYEIIDIWFEIGETDSIAKRQIEFARAIIKEITE